MISEQDKNAYRALGRFLGLGEMAAMYDAEWIVRRLREMAAEYRTAEAERKAREESAAPQPMTCTECHAPVCDHVSGRMFEMKRKLDQAMLEINSLGCNGTA
jgi:hypothetical protein